MFHDFRLWLRDIFFCWFRTGFDNWIQVGFWIWLLGFVRVYLSLIYWSLASQKYRLGPCILCCILPCCCFDQFTSIVFAFVPDTVRLSMASLLIWCWGWFIQMCLHCKLVHHVVHCSLESDLLFMCLFVVQSVSRVTSMCLLWVVYICAWVCLH